MQLSPIGKTQYRSHFKRLMTWTAVFIVAITLIFTYSKTAHAGLVSFMASILGSEKASAQIETSSYSGNSQNIPLPVYAVNTDPNPNKFGEVPIDKNALIADISASEASDTDSINTQISVYTVREGDTLSGIAKMFGVSINTIMWSNDLVKASGIQPGQTLIILPISGVKHVVKSGDTLESIAKLHRGDLNEIMQYNDLSIDSKLRVGDVVIVPDGEVAAYPATARSGSIAVGTKGPAYPSYIGYYMRPIVGGIKTQGLHGHNGVDLASSYGSNILASAAGDVIISKNSGWNGGYGSYIVIKHANGTQTLYGHLSATLVVVGEHVSQGEIIGKMGNTGSVIGKTGTHLHFEIRGGANPF